ncbi:hypothetical protein [Aeromonas caviae]
MSGFVWHDFGVLTRCVIAKGYVIITNDAGKSLKMSMVRIPAKLNSHSGQREHPDP